MYRVIEVTLVNSKGGLEKPFVVISVHNESTTWNKIRQTIAEEGYRIFELRTLYKQVSMVV